MRFSLEYAPRLDVVRDFDESRIESVHDLGEILFHKILKILFGWSEIWEGTYMYMHAYVYTYVIVDFGRDVLWDFYKHSVYIL